VLELKLRRKKENEGLLKMELDDLTGTLKMWEKMVGEIRNTARKSEEEQERVRRRQKKELTDMQLLANERLFRKLVPTLDNLELALNHSQVDAQHTAEQVIEGIRMTATHLFKSVQEAGLERVPSETGMVFDPAIHEAVERVPDSAQTTDTIAVCLSPGYALRGRLIRPARVSVYFGGATPKPDPPNDPPNRSEDSVDSA
jgi:molecular chaperone GrpE